MKALTHFASDQRCVVCGGAFAWDGAHQAFICLTCDREFWAQVDALGGHELSGNCFARLDALETALATSAVPTLCQARLFTVQP